MASNGKPAISKEVIEKLKHLKNESSNIMSQAMEINSDINEHKIVLNTLTKTDPERRCFRMIGGVLVERTVKDVIPAMNQNLLNLEQLMDKLLKELDNKDKEMLSFCQQNEIVLKDGISSADARKKLSQTS